MGYYTEFHGKFILDKPLSPNHKMYLERFSRVQHVIRDPVITASKPDPLREAAGLPLGEGAAYYVGDDKEGVLSYQCHPQLPGEDCNWTPNKDGTAIKWDGGDKFYYYTEWIVYLIHHFLQPWGYVLNGEVNWYGERRPDVGVIKIVNNTVSVNSTPRYLSSDEQLVYSPSSPVPVPCVRDD